MAIHVDIQLASKALDIPQSSEINRWISAVLPNDKHDAEVNVRIVDEQEITQLNSTYRHKTEATNVLSFPANLPSDLDLSLLGDIVICAPIVNTEANEQNKTLKAHWAHMLVHGTLHLLGYDHIDEQGAQQMEGLETAILTKLEFPPPYL